MRRARFFLFTLMLASTSTIALAGACGGDTGLSCMEGQFCKLPTNVCDPGAEGVCTDIPLDCPYADLTDRVCGCDGVDYDSRCLADLAGASLSRPGPCDGTCTGVLGQPNLCNADEFCQVDSGYPCCCDFPSTCVPLPTECPSHCQPVCGCNRVTYRTPCDAHQAGVTVDRPGRCKEVRNVRFVSADLMQWEPADGATGYNVYLDGDLFAAESAGATCQSAGLQTTTWEIPSVPNLGELWQVEITAEFPNGEGPMGMGSLCGNRQAAQSCGD
jgi:hypothetical protein